MSTKQHLPNHLRHLYARANNLAKAQKYAEAKRILNNILRLNAQDAEALNLLAIVHQESGEIDAAIEIWRTLTEQHPKRPAPWVHLALAYATYQHTQDEAERCARRGYALVPGSIDALTVLANILYTQSKRDESEALFTRALEIDTYSPAARNGLALLWRDKGREDLALEHLQIAYRHVPDSPELAQNIMISLERLGEVDALLELANEIAARKNPGIEIFKVYGVLQRFALFPDDQLLQKVMARFPHPDTHCADNTAYALSGVLLHLLAEPRISKQTLFDLHLAVGRYEEKNIVPLALSAAAQTLHTGKKIRLGYLSADFKNHVASKFIRSLIAKHDRNCFELHLFSALPPHHEDRITEQYKAACDHFHPLHALNDAEAARLIAEQQIHILVDLGGRTGGSRTGILPYRPAPVCIGYLGYPYTYGLRSLDYCLSDHWLNTPENQQHYAEAILELPNCAAAFGAFDVTTSRTDTALERNGYITFGSLSSPAKLNREVIAVWSKILLRCPAARLQLNHPAYTHVRSRQSVLDQFWAQGTAPDRIDIIHTQHPEKNHLYYYDGIDIVLDTFPFCGGTTTCEGLWMGTPTVTLVGQLQFERMSYTALKNLAANLEDCIASTQEEYIDKACALAARPERIKALKGCLRALFAESSFCQTDQFVRDFEETLLAGWNRKYPDQPLSRARAAQFQSNQGMAQAQRIMAYVMREQGAWYEPEAHFLTRHASLFKHFIDYGEFPEAYAVAVAQHQRGKIKVTHGSRQQELAAAQRHEFPHHGVEFTTRDQTCPEHADVIRLERVVDIADVHAVTTIIQRLDPLRTLVLAPKHSGIGTVGSEIPEQLVAAGLQAFVLMPGYQILVPATPDNSTSMFTAYLFYCHPELASRLANHACLASKANPPADLQAFMRNEAWRQLSSLPYANPLARQWQASTHTEWGDVYRIALNTYLAAQNPQLAPNDRIGLANFSASTIQAVIDQEANVSRLLSGIRILLAIGKREAAIAWCRLLYTGLKNQSGKALDEPFLAPLAEWESLPVGEDEIRWAHDIAFATHDRLQAFSSYFSSVDSASTWQALADSPYLAAESLRMRILIASRQQTTSPLN